MITGVAGMIGSHLLDELIKNHQYDITGVDNLSFGNMINIQQHLDSERFTFYRSDILDMDTLKIISKDVDIIIHLAAVKKIGEADSSLPTLMVNNRGTENVLEVAKMWGAKLILASTSDVYGMSPDLPFKEDGDLLLGPSMINRWSYAVSKLYDEQLAFAYYKDYGLPIVVLRYFGGFSARSSFQWSGGHIPIFIKAILENREVPIHGDGTQSRSMAYISDIISGTVSSIENSQAVGEIINIGNHEEMSVIESAKLIHRIANTGHELKIKYIPFKEIFGDYKDIQRRIPDLQKAKSILNYSPKVSMEDAIKTVLDTIKKRG